MKKIVLLFGVTCFVYLFSFGNQFVWDDEQFIVKNAYVQNIQYWPEYFNSSTTAGAGITSNYYRPLTTLSFAIDWAIWSGHAFGFHLTNTLLHAVGAVLIYLLLKKLLYVDVKTPELDTLAYLTSFAFALHPAQVEAVVYMNSRGDSLSLVYGALSVLLLMRTAQEKIENKRILLSLASFLSYLIALLSKETAVVWIGVSTLYVISHHLTKKTTRPIVILTTIAEFMLACLYFVLRFTVLQFQTAQAIWGTGNVYVNSIAVRLATFLFRAVPEYIGILIWPAHLHMERGGNIIKDVQDIPLLSWVIGVCIISLSIVLIYRFKTKKKLSDPVVLGACLLIMCISPFTGVTPLNDIMYEHWLYVPMIGWWLMVIYLVNRLLPKKIFLGLSVLVLTIWGILSIRQILIWRSPLTLYPHILKYADTARVHMNLGMALAENGEPEKAIAEYMRAAEISDTYPQIHHNLANVYVAQKAFDKAETEYEKALAIDPTFRFSLSSLIKLEIAQKNAEKAKYWATYAVETLPKEPEFQALYNVVYSTQW